jgi:hypothetical protein
MVNIHKRISPPRWTLNFVSETLSAIKKYPATNAQSYTNTTAAATMESHDPLITRKLLLAGVRLPLTMLYVH